jgi:hypothetical protein
MDESATLLLFACEGREHLMRETYDTFRARTEHQFQKTILAVDGSYEQKLIYHIQPDVLVQSPQRKGYVASVQRALPLVESEFFFWLEDDYRFNRDVDVEWMLDVLQAHEDAIQLRLISQILEPDQLSDPVEKAKGVYHSPFGFSCRPGVNRTGDVKTAMLEEPPAGNENIEHHMIDWCENNGRECLMVDPEDHPPISHVGHLEATSGQWHTTEPDEEWENPKIDTSANERATTAERLIMVVRLAVRVSYLTLAQLNDQRAYQLSRRVTNVVKQYADQSGVFKPAPSEKDGVE